MYRYRVMFCLEIIAPPPPQVVVWGGMGAKVIDFDDEVARLDNEDVGDIPHLEVKHDRAA